MKIPVGRPLCRWSKGLEGKRCNRVSPGGESGCAGVFGGAVHQSSCPRGLCKLVGALKRSKRSPGCCGRQPPGPAFCRAGPPDDGTEKKDRCSWYDWLHGRLLSG